MNKIYQSESTHKLGQFNQISLFMMTFRVFFPWSSSIALYQPSLYAVIIWVIAGGHTQAQADNNNE